MAKTYTLEEIAKHNTKEDLWITIDKKVYNVTRFGDQHPGGVEVLLEQAGKDASTEFADVGHSDDAKNLMKEFYIGELVEKKESPKHQTNDEHVERTHGARNEKLANTWVQVSVAVAAVAVVAAVVFFGRRLLK